MPTKGSDVRIFVDEFDFSGSSSSVEISAAVGVLAFNGDNGLPVYTVELVVLVAPIASNVYATSFATCLTIIDNIMTALEASVIANGWNEWVIRQEYATVGDVQYWSIVAKVEAS